MNQIEQIIQEIEALPVGDYSSPLAFAKIIYDVGVIREVDTVYRDCDGASVTDVVLVGIGGSHLGVQAIYDALHANAYVLPKVRLHAITSIDTFTLDSCIAWYTALLQDTTACVMTFVVSKSGATFETASQASLCFDILKKVKPADYHKKICVITDADSKLWQACAQENIKTVPIPKNIGGRYSVFSPAGLVVLRFLNINIVELLDGAQSVDITQPLATAEILFTYFKRDYLVHDTFTFIPRYAALGGWTRQLIGESLGKEQKGFLPTVSLGSQDLHSVVQQYFGGKQFTVTTFLTPSEYPTKTIVPDTLFSHMGSLRSGLTFADIQYAIIEGVKRSYHTHEKPFFVFTFRNGSAFDIGHYMQYKMLETVYMGALMEINPFDQPEVEWYKTETRRLLA